MSGSEISVGKALVMARINLRFSKLSYIITIVTLLSQSANLIQDLITGQSNGLYIDMANMLYLAVILPAVFIPARNFKRIMHLNGKKIDFYLGSVIDYAILAAAVSLLDLVIFFVSRSAFGSWIEIVNLVQIFGWLSHGVIVAFFEQFAFLWLLAAAVSTLTTAQTFWAGWVADAAVVAVVSVFTPIPMLRSALVWFFDLIIFNANAAAQIIACLALAVLLYAVGLLALRRRKI